MTNSEKSIIITGANTGLGYFCAKQIATENRSWHVVLACRDPLKAKIAMDKLIKETGNPNITFIQLDLSSFDSVKDFTSKFIQNNHPPLKGIVCNAGISGEDEVLFTKDGIESTFQVNCLSHFLLIQLLFKKLTPPARILMVSSELHRNDGPMKAFLPNYTNAQELAHPSKEKANLKGSGQIRYSTSKLCMLFYTHKIHDLLVEKGISNITINAFNPGLMPDAGLGGLNRKLFQKFFLKYILPLFVKDAMSTPLRSGKLLTQLMNSDKYDGLSGKYFDREKEIAPSDESFDKTKIDDLWDTSIKLTHVQNEI